MITQALVAIGGKATRLRNQGIPVPYSKAFLEVCGKPLLHWNLETLYAAGIRSLIIASQDATHLSLARNIVEHHTCRFASVVYFNDPGLGTHGLPFQVRHLLDDAYIFDCGHSINTPQHIQALASTKCTDNIVFSKFTPHPSNSRQPITIVGDSIEIAPSPDSQTFALAHPMAIDRNYAASLPGLHFQITEILNHYAQRKRLVYINSTLPPEFDTAQEMHDAMIAYERYIKCSRPATNTTSVADGQPGGQASSFRATAAQGL